MASLFLLSSNFPRPPVNVNVVSRKTYVDHCIFGVVNETSPLKNPETQRDSTRRQFIVHREYFMYPDFS